MRMMPNPAELIDYLQEKHLDKWITGYLRHLATRARAPRPGRPRHLIFAICDHYEPLWGKASESTGEKRVRAWEDGYPKMTAPFRDADGNPPKHSFFFPGEQYTTSFLERLANLARQGFGEVELHLHHDNDTAENLRRDIASYLDLYAKHGHFSRDKDGRPVYAFIHGNWALANARRDGRACGVDEEIPLLFDTGCYADFTFPAAPDECQPNTVNQIYWPTGDLTRKRAYEGGEPARVGAVKRDRILIIEGPLAFSLRPKLVPFRIESSHITGVDPGTPSRIKTWVSQEIHVAGRPEWIFVKVHLHGAPEKTANSYLGNGGRGLHAELTTRYNDGKEWILHYVTAREMYNIAMAAMEGRQGNPNTYRDHQLSPPPVACSSSGKNAKGER